MIVRDEDLSERLPPVLSLIRDPERLVEDGNLLEEMAKPERQKTIARSLYHWPEY